MEAFLEVYGMKLLGALLAALFGALGMAVGRVARALLNSEEKRAAAAAAVRFAEQVFGQLHGSEKLSRALEAASRQLERRGITVDREELIFLIEAAVGEFNRSSGAWARADRAETEQPTG